MSSPGRYAIYGWLDLTDGSSMDEALSTPFPLTYVSPIGYVLRESGHLQRPRNEWKTQMQKLRRRGSRIFPAIGSGADDADWIKSLADDQRVRGNAVKAVRQLAGEAGVDGITLRFTIPFPQARDEFSDFVEELAWALHSMEKMLAVSVAPQVRDPELDYIPDPEQFPDDWMRSQADSYDYRAIGAYADMFLAETVNFCRNPRVAIDSDSGEPLKVCEPSAVTPIGWLNSVIQHALLHVPPRRFLFTLPLYGRKWSRNDAGDVVPRIIPFAGWEDADTGSQGVREEVDGAAGGRKLQYLDREGLSQLLFIDSIQSLAEKASLVTRYDLGGAALFRLGFGTPDVWHRLFEIIQTNSSYR